MSFFDVILIQPIFNLLIFIYGLIPGHNLGLAIILFTIIVRLAMWPLVKKQLHQTKVMRQMQPELAAIKKKAKGNRQVEAQLMMELYREKGINPFGSIGIILLQLPIFIALFGVVRLITESTDNIAKYTYNFFEGLPGVSNAIHGGLDSTLFGLIDLTKTATSAGGGIYWPLILLALAAAVLQFIQSKQLLPEPKEKRRLRDVLKDQAAGKDVDQSEIGVLMTNKMIWLFPVLTFMVGVYLAGALVLYLVTQSAVAVIQQALALKDDEKDLEKVSEKTKTRARSAQPAEIVAKKVSTKKQRK